MSLWKGFRLIEERRRGQVSFRAGKALLCEEETHHHCTCSYLCFPSPFRSKGYEENLYLGTAFKQWEFRFCFIVIFKITICLLCVKPRKQKHNRSGCEGKRGSPWNSFTVFGVINMSVCCFRWSLALDNAKHISDYISKSLPSLFANFFF